MFQRRINKDFALVMACILVMSVVAMTGCGEQTAGEPAVEGKSVNSPVDVNYLSTNPIDIAVEDISDEEYGNFSYAKVTVTGLADTTIQDKINNTISEAIDAMKGAAPPPFRGVKAKMGENPEITSEWISAYATMNSNNILSMYIVRNVMYTDYNISDMQPLNIDLNTGTQIALKDVFCDDVDYREYLSDYVSQQLIDANADEEGYYEGSLGMTQTAPYKGVAEEQKFYLDEYTGNLVLVFDYATPEFDTSWYYATLSVPFDGNAAYTKRFMTDENIYTYDGPEQKQLLSVNMPYDCVNEISYDQPRTNLYVYSSVRYSSQMPEELQKLADGFGIIDSEKQDFVTEKYDEYAAKYGEDSVWGSYECNTIAGKISKYWYIREGVYLSVSNNVGDANESFSASLNCFHTYEDGSAEELTLYDVFKKDVNVEKLIKTTMKLQLEQSDELKGVTIEQDLVDMLFDNINGFCLNYDSLWVSYGDLRGILSDYGISEDDTFTYSFIVESLLFKNIGCENMVIFD